MSLMESHSLATRGKCRAAQLLFLLLWLGETFGALLIPDILSYTAFYPEDVSLKCEASGNPKPSIRWVKDGTLFKEESNSSGILKADPDKELKVYQGKYRCYASNALGTAESGLINLITEPIPVMSLKEKKAPKIVNEGESVVLQCNIPNSTVNGSIHWMDRKLMHIKQSDRIIIGLDGNLYFANVQIKNTRDDYTCYIQYVEARTILSTEPLSLIVRPSNVLVNRPPYLHHPHGTHSSYSALRGQTLILECIPYGLKDAMLSSSQATLEHFDRWLEFSSITESDDGEYTCTASNDLGQVTHSYTVNVEELPPQILTDDNRVYQVTEESTASLSCSTFGSPRPQVTWKSEKFSPVLSNTRMSQLTNDTLLITNVSLEDAGTYLCSVQNTNLSITAQLDVLSKTRIVSPLHDHRTLRGKSLVWPCRYEVDAQLSNPLIQWRKDGQKILTSSPDDKYTAFKNGSLMITDIHAEDAGLYTCEVITRLDFVTTTGLLTVIDKPEPPPSLKLDEKESRSVTLSWSPGSDNNSPVFEFVIEVREDLHLVASSWKELKRVPAEIHHLEISLLPYCMYHFRVAAVNEIGTSGFSPHSESYTTPAAEPDLNPGNVRSESTNPDSMIITWEHFNGPGFGYKVFWREADDSENVWQSRVVSHPPVEVDKTNTFTPFEIKVQALNGIGEGPSPEAAIGYSGEDPTMKETVQEMERALESEGKREKVIVVEGKEDAIVSGLEFYSDYQLSVAAFNSKGEGPLSSPINFRTPEGAPGPVSNLRFESPSESELMLIWRKPHKTNGILRGYVIMYQEFVENGPSMLQSVKLDDPTVTRYKVDNLNTKNYYIFSLKAFTDAGEGEPVHINATTLLDGGEWEESEQVNLTQGFYQLQGLKAGSYYRLEVRHNNVTYWTQDLQTKGPVTDVLHSSFATQGWFIGLISAIVLLLLLLLILCFVKKSKGGKYSVKDKEEGQMDSDAKAMKDEAFGEYSSDSDEKRSCSQRSLCADLKRESDDSLGEYGDSVDIQFNEDGSFIGQYSGRRDTQPHAHGEHESSGVPSPNKPNPPPSNSFPTSITGGN
ncbi:Neural cell adhesion molecule L1.1 [Bagarius yarrelli]|uniref:Neural cell adhesion molecule L1.1 n=1 Tax=Bagarius yarrelli TaxID=175774 RepID=A0A556VU49_BAGYA|nr:Neural cell adhesion molecule L1.1 [Bagarius yarrelli]